MGGTSTARMMGAIEDEQDADAGGHGEALVWVQA